MCAEGKSPNITKHTHFIQLTVCAAQRTAHTLFVFDECSISLSYWCALCIELVYSSPTQTEHTLRLLMCVVSISLSHTNHTNTYTLSWRFPSKVVNIIYLNSKTKTIKYTTDELLLACLYKNEQFLMHFTIS